MNLYKDFTDRLRLLAGKHPNLITTTLSNIFTMRLIGNKTHGDLAEIAMAEFINQYMYDFRAAHVGKDLYRAKSKEEDIKIINEMTKAEFPVSLKAYGDGPLQLSTDKNFRMFPRLEQEGDDIVGRENIARLLADPAFSDFRRINILPLIYDEKAQRCNILVFDYHRAETETSRISRETGNRGRKHPVYRFYNAANALQRGLWTHTKNCGQRKSVSSFHKFRAENPSMQTMPAHRKLSKRTRLSPRIQAVYAKIATSPAGYSISNPPKMETYSVPCPCFQCLWFQRTGLENELRIRRKKG